MAAPLNRVSCGRCAVVLDYPAGAQSVRCPLCENITVIPQMRIQCLRCVTPLVIPGTAELISCPRCHLIMRAPRQQQQQQQQLSRQAPAEQKCMVYVENP
ncbi:putative Zinc finger protein, partial [Diplonema papillatum]